MGEPKDIEREKPSGIKKSLGLNMFREYPVLIWLMFMVIASQIVATTTTLRMQEFVADTFGEKDLQTSFLGYYYSALNTASIVLQFAFCPVVIPRVRIGLIHRFIPFVHLVAGIVVFVAPSLYTVAGAAIIFKAFDYSFFNASKGDSVYPLSL